MTSAPPAAGDGPCPASQDHYRWVMLALLWLVYATFGLVVRSIAPLVTPILEDLGISFSQMGIILGSWQLAYIAVAMAAGTLLDRWGVRGALLAGVIIVGLSAGLRALAGGFWSLLACVALFGCGGPLISIGGPKAVAQWFGPARRGTALGIFTTGSWIGGLTALALTNSTVMPLVGGDWRRVSVLYGLTAAGIGLLWGGLAREKGGAERTAGGGMLTVFGHLLGVRTVRVVLLMALCTFTVVHGFINWLPRILESSGFSASAAGYAAAIPMAAGTVGMLVVPHVIRPHHRAHVIAWGALVIAAGLVGTVHLSGGLRITALVAVGFISAPFLPLMLLILMDCPEVGARRMGAAGGLFFCVAEIGGFSGPSLMGLLKDLSGGFAAGTALLVGLCLSIAGLTRLLARSPGRHSGVHRSTAQ